VRIQCGIVVDTGKMKRNWCLVALALVTWTSCQLAAANHPQDDSDMIFDDDLSGLLEMSEEHSVVRRDHETAHPLGH